MSVRDVQLCVELEGIEQMIKELRNKLAQAEIDAFNLKQTLSKHKELLELNKRFIGE